jgi:hypothetical protein
MGCNASCGSMGSYWRTEVGEREATGEREAIGERTVVMGDCDGCDAADGDLSWDIAGSTNPAS